MALFVNTPSCCMLKFNLNLKKLRETQLSRWSSSLPALNRPTFKVRVSCFFNPVDQPILRDALKEPVAFMGGMFAGILRLDLEEEPLKEWVTRTVEASGVTVEDIDSEGSKPEEIPHQIEIE